MAKTDIADAVGRGIDLEHLLRSANRMDPPPPDVATLPEEDLPDPAVQALLVSDKKGFPKPTYANAVLIVSHDRRWSSLRLNELGPVAEVHGEPLNEARLVNDLSVWISRVYGVSFGAGTLRDVIAGVVASRTYNPVQEYLSALRWDGAARIEHVCEHVLGVQPTPIYSAFIAKFFVGAVARALAPGCKLDTALILIGKQGAFKSTFFRTLFGKWFADSPIPIGSKDAFIQLGSCWGYEASELESLGRATAEAVKQFLSASSDTYRGVFERHARPRPRRAVMVGSTNREAFLTDETGSRRFWPITVPGQIDIAQLQAWRDQLWAEAVARYRAGESWWLTPEEDGAREEHATAYADEDVWLGTIRAYLMRTPGDTTIAAVLSSALEMDAERMDYRAQRRVGAILTQLGYARVALPRVNGARPTVWRRRAE